jgi:two-component system sensor histidine kinase DctS
MGRQIADNSHRIKKIIEGLQYFAHEDSDMHRVNSSLSSIVNEVLNLCSEKLKNHNVVFINKQNDFRNDPAIYCHPVQISQVLLNLINNAHDAVLFSKEKHIELESSIREKEVILRVSDSGPGIPLEIRDKIFEPFFTTKTIGSGMGLGLSISKGIIESHGGRIELNTHGGLTTFLVFLPLSESKIIPDNSEAIATKDNEAIHEKQT